MMKWPGLLLIALITASCATTRQAPSERVAIFNDATDFTTLEEMNAAASLVAVVELVEDLHLDYVPLIEGESPEDQFDMILLQKVRILEVLRGDPREFANVAFWIVDADHPALKDTVIFDGFISHGLEAGNQYVAFLSENKNFDTNFFGFDESDKPIFGMVGYTTGVIELAPPANSGAKVLANESGEALPNDSNLSSPFENGVQMQLPPTLGDLRTELGP